MKPWKIMGFWVKAYFQKVQMVEISRSFHSEKRKTRQSCLIKLFVYNSSAKWGPYFFSHPILTINIVVILVISLSQERRPTLILCRSYHIANKGNFKAGSKSCFMDQGTWWLQLHGKLEKFKKLCMCYKSLKETKEMLSSVKYLPWKQENHSWLSKHSG